MRHCALDLRAVLRMRTQLDSRFVIAASSGGRDNVKKEFEIGCNRVGVCIGFSIW